MPGVAAGWKSPGAVGVKMGAVLGVGVKMGALGVGVKMD